MHIEGIRSLLLHHPYFINLYWRTTFARKGRRQRIISHMISVSKDVLQIPIIYMPLNRSPLEISTFSNVFMLPRPRPAGGIACPGWLYVWTSVHPYVRPKTRLRFSAKVESQVLLMVASWFFICGYISMRPAGIYKSHDLMTYISQSTDFGLWPDYQV